jgi:hypothetical protein
MFLRYNFSAKIAPTAIIGSVSKLTMALGALLHLAASRIVAALVLDPIPRGKKRIFPETFFPYKSCLLFTMRPDLGSRESYKHIGCLVTRASPLEMPCDTGTHFITMFDKGILLNA